MSSVTCHFSPSFFCRVLFANANSKSAISPSSLMRSNEAGRGEVACPRYALGCGFEPWLPDSRSCYSCDPPPAKAKVHWECSGQLVIPWGEAGKGPPGPHSALRGASLRTSGGRSPWMIEMGSLEAQGAGGLSGEEWKRQQDLEEGPLSKVRKFLCNSSHHSWPWVLEPGTRPCAQRGREAQTGEKSCLGLVTGLELVPNHDLALTAHPHPRGTALVGDAPRRGPGTWRGTQPGCFPGGRVSWAGVGWGEPQTEERQCERERKRH